ncbi:MAG: DUF4978 domain-containing protein [Bacillales bacterium]|nr:DUF4978 domain-containing protein [Bacillales bacterium]
MKKLLMTALLLTSCTTIPSSSLKESSSLSSSESSLPTAEDILVSQVRTVNGKTYLEVEGNPFTIFAAQLRLDGLMNRAVFSGVLPPLEYSEMEKYFEYAHNLGLNTLGIPLEWSKIEIEEDVYDFTLMDNILFYLDKYNLKVEWLWFSYNMCGDTHSFTMPDYINNNKIDYPDFPRQSASYYNKMYGWMSNIDLSNSLLLQREQIVLEKIMDYLYERAKTLNKKETISFQIHNESDGLLRWRLEQSQISDPLTNELFTPERLWELTLNSLNSAGLAVKNSKYKCLTRVNATVNFGLLDFPQFPNKELSHKQTVDLPGIDIVGDDPYVTDIKTVAGEIEKLRYHNNYPHISENMGEYENSASLMLGVYQQGGSYVLYDLATPAYFIQINGNSAYQMDQGILTYNLEDKAHTDIVRQLVLALNKANSVLPLIDSQDFAIYNLNNQFKIGNYTQTVKTTQHEITFNASDGSLGFAFSKDNYIYYGSSGTVNFTLKNGIVAPVAEIGYFNKEGEFVRELTTYLTDKMISEAGKLYRVKVNSISREVISDTNDYLL